VKIVAFREVETCDWDALAASSPEAWLNHDSGWIALEGHFFVNANLSFALIEHAEVVGIQPLYLSEGPSAAFGERLLHSGIHRHTGLATRAGIGSAGKRAVRSAAMDEIFRLAELFDVDRIQLNAHNLAPVNRSKSREHVPFWVSDFGFQLGIGFGPNGMTPFPGVSTLNADQLIDLDPPEDVLLANLDEGCRRAIRKATKAGLEFEIARDFSDLKDYFEIAQESAVRTGESLAPAQYYEEIFRRFFEQGRVHLLFARSQTIRVAALLLLSDKGAVHFLGGVSRSGSLNLRPNDFLHWHAMRWAKCVGFQVYRLGPWFPEVPRDWPISRVSHFKTKFGSSSVPIIQGSMFRHPEKYLQQIPAVRDNMERMGQHIPTSFVPRRAGSEFLAHLLRIFGLSQASPAGSGDLLVLYRPGAEDVSLAREVLARAVPIVAVLPSVEFSKAFAVVSEARTIGSPRVLRAEMLGSKPWKRLRTLHSYLHFLAEEGVSVVSDDEGHSAWLCVRAGRAPIVFVGTDIVADVIRYRQGDPAAAKNRPTQAMWGIPGERPNYLFEAQLAGESLRERPADWWCEALAEALTRLCGQKRQAMLPNGAAGAIVVTGDDDQAGLSRYAQQRDALGSMPVTYYLHPLTKHTGRTLKQLKTGRRVELGLHPDALEHPEKYAELFSEQARWFQRLTGKRTRTIRNHGFLNDGYWGHAKTWNAHGVMGSSNLPGLDGCILNGSLLPAKLVLDDQLTEHWSILTAIGDGIVFVHGWDDQQSANCILDFADLIRNSGVPGVLVVNLHPENIDKTRGMHRATLKVVEDGFIPWTLSECFDWFERHSKQHEPLSSRFSFPWAKSGGGRII
jgi:Acetyltransferase (GNAT) domain